jgi:hypothetical protein
LQWSRRQLELLGDRTALLGSASVCPVPEQYSTEEQSSLIDEAYMLRTNITDRVRMDDLMSVMLVADDWVLW